MLGLPKRVTAANNLLCVLPKSVEEPQLRKHGVMLSMPNAKLIFSQQNTTKIKTIKNCLMESLKNFRSRYATKITLVYKINEIKSLYKFFYSK